MDADENRVRSVAVGDVHPVGEREINVAIAGHHYAVPFFLQHVACESGDFQRVFFFVAEIPASARVPASVASIDDDSAKVWRLFDVGRPHDRIDDIAQVGARQKVITLIGHNRVAEFEQDVVHPAFLRAGPDDHFDLGVFKGDGFALDRSFEKIEFFETAQGDTALTFIGHSFPFKRRLSTRRMTAGEQKEEGEKKGENGAVIDYHRSIHWLKLT